MRFLQHFLHVHLSLLTTNDPPTACSRTRIHLFKRGWLRYESIGDIGRVSSRFASPECGPSPFTAVPIVDGVDGYISGTVFLEFDGAWVMVKDQKHVRSSVVLVNF